MKKAILGDYITGYSVKNKNDEDIPVYSVTNDKGFCTEYFSKDVSGKDKSKYKIVPRGYVAYNPSRINVGSVDWQNCEDRVIVSPLYVVFKTNEKLDNDYLKYYLKSDIGRYYINENAVGAVRANLKLDILSKFRLPIPDIEEQRKIVSQLKLIDEMIELKKQEIEIFDKMIKARFVEMFENKDFPKVKLGIVSKLQGGYAFKSSDFVNEGIPLVQIGNVNVNDIDWNIKNMLPLEYGDKYVEYSLKQGDLVMAMTRPVIKSLDTVKISRISNDDIPCLLNQRVGRFLLSDKINSIYLEAICKQNNFKIYIEQMSSNSLQPNVSSKQVEEYEIILSPIELQNQFADFVHQVDKSKVEAKSAIEKLKILQKNLMQKYFC